MNCIATTAANPVTACTRHQALLTYRIVHDLVIAFQRASHRRYAAHRVSMGHAWPLRADKPLMEEIIDARQALDVLLKRAPVELPTKWRLAFKLSRVDGLICPLVAARMGSP